MKLSEDLVLSIRALKSNPTESLLLIIGLALSIGATAAGLAMYEKAGRETEDLLQQVEYREIVASSRTAAEDMDTALTPSQTNDLVRLNISDLAAADISPSISYSYIASETRLRFNTASFANEFSSRAGRAPGQGAANATSTPTNNFQGGAGTNTATQGDTDRPLPPEGGPEGMPGGGSFELATSEGPEPLLEEVQALEVSVDYFSAHRLFAIEGSIFTDQDIENQAQVMVVGSTLAKTLFEDGIALGREVASFNRILTIIGVLEETGTTIDDKAFLPSAAANADAASFRFNFGSGTQLHFVVEDSRQLAAAEQQLQSYFDAEYDAGSVILDVPREEAEAASSRSEKVALITIVLALAALLIASVNVSNILYSRALRRRKQVGILKALGAARLNIFGLFFKEALLLLVAGAILGLLIALGFSSLLVENSGEAPLATYALVLGIIAASIITLSFTLFPALQASRIPPAIAMRVE